MPHEHTPYTHGTGEELESTRPPSTHQGSLSPQPGALLLASPCSAIMTVQPVFCELGDPADVVARLMVVEDIGAVPVVNSLNDLQLCGIVTDRDLTVKIVAEGYDPKSVMIDDVMTRTVISCTESSTIQEVLDLMAEHQVRRVPVVGEGQQLVGIIAQADIASRVAYPAETARVIKEISQPGFTHEASPSGPPISEPSPQK